MSCYRTIQYFLNFVKNQPNGKHWLDTHIHTFVAVGAPFLGAPKAVRGLISGDSMGLDTFLTTADAIRLAHSISKYLSLFLFAIP
jgi:hypothetical protein